jgi:hypothetical protein
MTETGHKAAFGISFRLIWVKNKRQIILKKACHLTLKVTDIYNQFY